MSCHNTFSTSLPDACAYCMCVNFKIHGHALLFMPAYTYCMCVSAVRNTLGAGTADSTRIICTLAHLCRTQETHHHSTENSPSFLKGLETQKKREREREKGRGERLLFYFLQLAESLLQFSCNDRSLRNATSVSSCLSPSLSLLMSNKMLVWRGTRSRCTLVFEQEESSQKCEASTVSDSLTDARCLSMGVYWVWYMSFFFFYQQSTPPSGVCIEQISGCSKEWNVMRETLHQQLFICTVTLPWHCQRREDQY